MSGQAESEKAAAAALCRAFLSAGLSIPGMMAFCAMVTTVTAQKYQLKSGKPAYTAAISIHEQVMEQFGIECEVTEMPSEESQATIQSGLPN